MSDKNIESKYGCFIEHFIEDEYSICREERQYAVFLYNILRKYHNADERKGNDIVTRIFTACRIPEEANIQKVFYEATFMRDFFERNRRLKLGKDPDNTLLNNKFSPLNSNYHIEKIEDSFNAKLIAYVVGKQSLHKDKEGHLNDVKEIHLGQNTLPSVYGWLSEQQINKIREMMNVKPDIAVIYLENGQKKLLFLECKFESREKTYPSGSTQRKIQCEIAEFLCEYILKEEKVCISDEMKKTEKSCLVKFVRKETKKENQLNTSGEIWLRDLIELDREIFL